MKRIIFPGIILGEGINNLLDVRRNVLSDAIHDALCEGDGILSDRFANALQCDLSLAGENELKVVDVQACHLEGESLERCAFCKFKKLPLPLASNLLETTQQRGDQIHRLGHVGQSSCNQVVGFVEDASVFV